jgi:hypothetical protein
MKHTRPCKKTAEDQIKLVFKIEKVFGMDNEKYKEYDIEKMCPIEDL